MNRRIYYIVILVVVIITATVLFYPKYKIWQKNKENLIIQNKISEFSKLIVANHDCKKVLEDAKNFIKTHKDVVEIWSYKGACEFDTMDFNAAKISFQKVLSLNPENEVAKNYLTKMEIKPGEIVLGSEEFSFDETQYKTETGLIFSDILKLEKLVKRQANIPEYLLATYISDQKFDQVVNYLKQELQNKDFHYSTSPSNTQVIFAKMNDQELIIIKVDKKSPVSVIINYQKLK